MPFNNSISKYDWQYLVTGFSLISVFIFTDLIGVIDKEYFYFVPRLISDQPYRIFTSILTHADLNHLLSNLGGIIITRYFLMRLTTPFTALRNATSDIWRMHDFNYQLPKDNRQDYWEKECIEHPTSSHCKVF